MIPSAKAVAGNSRDRIKIIMMLVENKTSLVLIFSSCMITNAFYRLWLIIWALDGGDLLKVPVV